MMKKILGIVAVFTSFFSYTVIANQPASNNLEATAQSEIAMSTHFNNQGELLLRCEDAQNCEFIDIELEAKAVVPSHWSISLPSIVQVNHDNESEALMIEFYGPSGEHVSYNALDTESCRSETSKFGLCDDGEQPTNPLVLEMISAGLELEYQESLP